MEKLLSSIIAGERKGDVSEELKGKRIKVKFLGYTEDGKAKILLGNKVIIADVETDRQFTEGEELIFLIKSLYPKLELKLIKLDEKWSNQFILLKLLPFLDSKSIKQVISEIFKKEIKEISSRDKKIEDETLKKFIKMIFSPKGAADTLLTVKELLIQSKGNLSEKDFRKLILSMLAFYFLPVGNIVFFPLKVNDTDVEILFEKDKDGCKVEIEISKNSLFINVSIFAISNEVSIEFKAENKEIVEALKKRDAELKTKLLSAGFIPVSITYKKEKTEKEKLLEKVKVHIDSGKINISV
ncbi:hypothetical protein [Desulfurobacterium atlanticum]|uniref:Flagellar hook-length control protein FliK n=1 Tax=Desulfurobacterium atlanticum TaxID=240169 RepID=A0A238XMH2_9BACT|nr:hypothetical protein [Desulfurobacterium atlanticum]SNR59554.1 hypothetical protein SAMN06265340_10175 [Desulfurobacterium atlanticum]